MCSFFCVLSVNCFCATTAEFNSYDRDYMACKPKIYTFWPCIEKKIADPCSRQIKNWGSSLYFITLKLTSCSRLSFKREGELGKISELSGCELLVQIDQGKTEYWPHWPLKLATHISSYYPSFH